MDDQVRVLSCPLCLRADEEPSMVEAQIDHALGDHKTAVTVCAPCARAIAEALRAGESERFADASAADSNTAES